jgi:hypothetical protein
VSLHRYAKKRDAAEPAIVDALEAAGIHVYPIDEPCDLLCWSPRWGAGVFKTLEVKTPRGKKGSIRTDKRQEAQINFLSTTGTPVVRTPIEALKAVGVMT